MRFCFDEELGGLSALAGAQLGCVVQWEASIAVLGIYVRTTGEEELD